MVPETLKKCTPGGPPSVIKGVWVDREGTFNKTFLFRLPLLTFSLLISEDFWVFLSFLSERNVLITSDNVLKILRSLGKERKTQKSSLISKEKVHKVGTSLGLSWDKPRASPCFAHWKCNLSLAPTRSTDGRNILFKVYMPFRSLFSHNIPCPTSHTPA